MYQIENSRQILLGRASLLRTRHAWPAVSRTVVLLGLTSFFTDISSEMVSTILPIYLLFALHLAPLQFGIIDGLYQGGSVLVRMASGFISDRWHRPKEVAAFGYGLSAICKLGFLFIKGPFLALTGVVLIDRIGKGIRTAPRDAMISLSSPSDGLGNAFGVHRAMDTAGAMIGPLLAFAILVIAPDAFDAIFVVSFCFAILGLGVIVLLVRDPGRGTPEAIPLDGPEAADDAIQPEPAPRITVAMALGLLRIRPYRVVVLLGSLLALATLSDAFIYVALQAQLDFNIGFFPLLYVATAFVYMVLAVPFGRLADRVGRARVFVVGYVLLGVVYASLLLPSLGPVQILLAIVLLGTYYAMTDGVLQALVSPLIPGELRSSGLAFLGSTTSLARLFASVLFGLLWMAWGMQAAIAFFLVALLVVAAIAGLAMTRRGRAAAYG